eukprot:TRINITY_DN42831_c0_g1_i1.p1 TRINITY_DN42831_c0_g1~~TRINITY_DN42831_c0_g1_i1.p1  ORF type:complete len:432 (-),score=78.89 TRINITY_DN42831_c0_g1_i1:173-1468(-)
MTLNYLVDKILSSLSCKICHGDVAEERGVGSVMVTELEADRIGDEAMGIERFCCIDGQLVPPPVKACVKPPEDPAPQGLRPPKKPPPEINLSEEAAEQTDLQQFVDNCIPVNRRRVRTTSQASVVMQSWSSRQRESSRFDSECDVSPTSSVRRFNSQAAFARKDQTVIVFDWDDTLFPTTCLLDAMKLDVEVPLDLQVCMTVEMLEEASKSIRECEDQAINILTLARELGHVVVVTLASEGWVSMVCKNFFPRLGEVLKEHDVPVIYALVGQDEESNMAMVKARAMAKAVTEFYSQYRGQTWKNLVSIGDSHFERDGMLTAARAYVDGTSMQSQGVEDLSPTMGGHWQREVNGHLYKVRVKLCKLLSKPDVDEITLQLDLVGRWLDKMVATDGGFELNLAVLEDEAQVQVITEVFDGELPLSALPKPKRRH